ncbi:hypothetical protein [Halalkalicoccus salilacus]|uniref:hypothetical protein n=1 Tax=Halalkalicoccus salilacus TaxID=3117459 RepID=UPI00300EAB13
MHGADAGPPTGNGNAITHGVRATPENLIDHLDDRDREWIEDLADGYRELGAIEPDDPRSHRITLTCVMCFQECTARGETIANDLTSRSTVGIDEDGRPVVRVEEHYLMGAASSLHRDIRATLDKLDLLNPDDVDRGRRSSRCSPRLARNTGSRRYHPTASTTTQTNPTCC